MLTASMIPRYQKSPGAENHRTAVNLSASTYDHDEVPLQLPLPWKVFSNGEELSERHINGLAWSPHGLGKHGSCLLAVLTSNHVLSLWECSGRLEIKDDWKRSVMVNRFIVDTDLMSDQVQQTDGVDAISKQALRINSFCWVPLTSTAQPRDGLAGRLDPARHHLAVSTHDGYITVLRVESAYDLLKPGLKRLSLTVVARFKAVPESFAEGPLLQCLPSTQPRRPPLLDELSWSPWTIGPDNALASTLAFISHDRLHTMRVRILPGLKTSTFDFESAVCPRIPGLSEHVSGPLRWAPKPTREGGTRLVFFNQQSLYCLSLSFLAGVSLTRQPFDQTWDHVSGMLRQ